MRLKFTAAVLILATALIFVSCNGIEHLTNRDASKPAAPAAPKPGEDTVYADGARRVTIDELEAMMKKGEAFVVDVRNDYSYNEGHIPGSRLIPEGEILNHLNELPRDKTIVTYCS